MSFHQELGVRQGCIVTNETRLLVFCIASVILNRKPIASDTWGGSVTPRPHELVVLLVMSWCGSGAYIFGPWRVTCPLEACPRHLGNLSCGQTRICEQHDSNCNVRDQPLVQIWGLLRRCYVACSRCRVREIAVVSQSSGNFDAALSAFLPRRSFGRVTERMFPFYRDPSCITGIMQLSTSRATCRTGSITRKGPCSQRQTSR